MRLIVREPAVDSIIMWLRPKGLKVYSYVEMYAEFKNQSLKKSAGTQSCYVQGNTPGVASSKISKNLRVPFTPASNDLPCTPRTISHGCPFCSYEPLNAKKNVSNK